VDAGVNAGLCPLPLIRSDPVTLALDALAATSNQISNLKFAQLRTTAFTTQLRGTGCDGMASEEMLESNSTDVSG
jgi:hypothetical protein